MLETDLEMDEKGMTVPYPPFFDDVRKNNGFVIWHTSLLEETDENHHHNPDNIFR